MYDHWPNWPLTLYGFKTRNADVLCRNPMTDGELPGDSATEARRTPSSAIEPATPVAIQSRVRLFPLRLAAAFLVEVQIDLATRSPSSARKLRNVACLRRIRCSVAQFGHVACSIAMTDATRGEHE